MNNSELVEKLETRQTGLQTTEEKETRSFKFLIFHADDRYYALYAEEVKEIITGTPLFYLPFAPSYVRGLINRHGEPHTVLDLLMVFEQRELTASTYLVLSREHDQITFLITDVDEIIRTEEADIHLITTREEQNNHFIGALNSQGREIFILNTQSICQRLVNDLERE
jgi:purine-binding chemotaxis protein CheW